MFCQFFAISLSVKEVESTVVDESAVYEKFSRENILDLYEFSEDAKIGRIPSLFNKQFCFGQLPVHLKPFGETLYYAKDFSGKKMYFRQLTDPLLFKDN